MTIAPEVIDHEPDPVRQYLDQVGTVALLTAQEEVELAKRIEAGVYAAELLRHGRADGRRPPARDELEAVAEDGARAKDHMIKANLRLVVAAARKFRWSPLPLLDLIQEGNLGLIRAVEKFDYAKGYKFSTYAMWWIRQAMQRGNAFQGRTIRLPDHVLDQVTMLQRRERDLAQRLHRSPTAEELAEATQLTVGRVFELRRAAHDTVSLDSPVGDEDTPLGELIGNVRTGDDDADGREAAAELVRARLALLAPDEAKVIAFRYGLLDGRYHTLQETAAHVGLGRERVRRLERQAVDHMRHPGETRSAA
ncbi:sigma-70 family RNA polymerase sigma factor [Pseudonocardia acaciae]|uniref:sigma-70 family RNA polymerase sigma factor n=1 Tax=Pseudonocardia acaciae TaxID=551276 RepID=UPI00055E2260|nr:sigma-70 family RNA polymerase sigma factor [Pseudonocardia acaciae]